MKEALSVRLERILRPAFSLDEIKAVEFVRSFVFEKLRYDKLEKNYSHEVYGVAVSRYRSVRGNLQNRKAHA